MIQCMDANNVGASISDTSCYKTLTHLVRLQSQTLAWHNKTAEHFKRSTRAGTKHLGKGSEVEPKGFEGSRECFVCLFVCLLK